MSDHSVSVAIYGGLGNQLFQYALGRTISHRNSCTLQLDLRHFDRHKAFGYGLKTFNIQALVGTEQSLPPSKQNQFSYLKWRYLSKNPRMIRERSLGFDQQVLESRGRIHLHGYWQSYRYFAPIANQIRQDLTWANPPTGKNEKMLQRILAEPSIAIHVRRGDYVSNIHANQFHGTCHPNYFALGVEEIRSRVHCRPTVFVFSDDHQWATEHIKVDCECVFVSHNDGFAAHEDMRLMAACQHQVISNSTFSWWAAWLNPNPKKEIIAPMRWFADPRAQNDDLIPDGWTRIDANQNLSLSDGLRMLDQSQTPRCTVSAR